MAHSYYKLPLPDQEEFAEQYYDPGVTLEEMGRRYDVSREQIGKWQREMGLKSRREAGVYHVTRPIPKCGSLKCCRRCIQDRLWAQDVPLPCTPERMEDDEAQ